MLAMGKSPKMGVKKRKPGVEEERYVRRNCSVCLSEIKTTPCGAWCDPELDGCHEADHLLSHQHLQQLNGEMKLPKFLSPLKSHRRQRSKARSEISPAKGQSEVDPAAPRPTESTPDLRIGTSAFPTPSPLTGRGWESEGMHV